MSQNEWEEQERIYGCWLCNCPDIGNRQLNLLVEICGGSEAAYFADSETWGKALSPKQVERLKAHTAGWRPKEEYQRMLDRGIRLVTIGDAAYPKRLKEIPDAPYGLFYLGKLPYEDAPAVAVIGARECSEYGRYVAGQLGAALGRKGILLISGMARGVDGISQKAALDAGGYSAGVLGCGVDICYPKQNKELYERLLDCGAVMSTYPVGTPAYARNFPPRNRIVSGLADAVVVIEARAKSGTLITVDMALEQGREVYVVPGRVTDRLSDGCNRLIKQGAAVLLDLEEFLEEIGELREKKGGFQDRDGQGKIDGDKGKWTERTRGGEGKTAKRDKALAEEETKRDMTSGEGFELGGRMPKKLSCEMDAVYQILDFTPKSMEEIRRGLPPAYRNGQITAWLMGLMVEGLVIQVSPGHFCLKG